MGAILNFISTGRKLAGAPLVTEESLLAFCGRGTHTRWQICKKQQKWAQVKLVNKEYVAIRM